MSGLKNRPDLRAGDSARAVIGVQNPGLEGTLSDPFAAQALAEHGSVVPPCRIVEVYLDRAAQDSCGHYVEEWSVGLV